MEPKWKINNNGLGGIPFWNTQKIEESLTEVYNEYERVLSENKRLVAENNELKSGAWKDKKFAEMANRYDEMSEDISRGFPVTKEESEAIKKWMEQHEKQYTGTIGGRYEYRFFPTSIGVCGKVVDTLTDDSFTFQELG